jgi:polysaccharide deacetylase family protein (PEP-CTERM system associated)
MSVLNAITVDVEDFFHAEAMSPAAPRDAWNSISCRVEQNTLRLLELFSKAEVKGTFFVLGWVAEKFPALIRRIAADQHEIACHSYWHRPVFRLTPQEFQEDTLRAKQVIEDAIGASVRGYRAPSFSMTPGTEWASEILAELGFTYDSSVNPIFHDFYGNPYAPRVPNKIAQGRLTELPIATLRVVGTNLPVGGGAYLRILPLWYTSLGVERMNQIERQPCMVYLHPWEIDAGQPRLAVSWKSQLRHYTSLGRMEAKLAKLLRRFKFGRVDEAFANHLIK